MEVDLNIPQPFSWHFNYFWHAYQSPLIINMLHWLTPVEPAVLVLKCDNPIYFNHARFQPELNY